MNATAPMLPIEGLPAHAVDDETRSLLELMAGDPIHDRDRRRIVQAVVAEAHSAGGKVDPNRLRARLTNAKTGALDVTPVMVGSIVGHFARRKVLEHIGWTPCSGSTSGNNGKPQKVYRLRAIPQEASK